MAIALQPKFPIPNRSKQKVRREKDEDGVIERPFRAEMWAQDQVSALTIFFSTISIENLDNDAVQQLVENEKLVSFKSGKRYCTSLKFVDDAGAELWSVNIVVGDEGGTFIEGSIPIFPYSKDGYLDTMFNATSMRAVS